MTNSRNTQTHPEPEHRYSLTTRVGRTRPIFVPELREGRAGGPTIINGYGAVYYDGTEGTEYKLWDDLYERIMPGCFDRAIREDDVAGLYNHCPNHVLGRTSAGTMKLVSDSTGLRYSITPGDTSVSRDVLTWLRRKEVRGSSFSFWVDDEEAIKDGSRMIRQVFGVHLVDTGPVLFPAYKSTTAGTGMGMEEEPDGDELPLRSRRKVPDFIMARLRVLEIEGSLTR